jgi:hypothetical protein
MDYGSLSGDGYRYYLLLNRRGGPEFIFPDVTYVPIARSRPVPELASNRSSITSLFKKIDLIAWSYVKGTTTVKLLRSAGTYP